MLLADRGFCSFAHLALLWQSQTYAVFRIHQRTVVSFIPRRKYVRQLPKRQRAGVPRSRVIKSLAPKDQLVIYYRPDKRPVDSILKRNTGFVKTLHHDLSHTSGFFESIN